MFGISTRCPELDTGKNSVSSLNQTHNNRFYQTHGSCLQWFSWYVIAKVYQLSEDFTTVLCTLLNRAAASIIMEWNPVRRNLS